MVDIVYKRKSVYYRTSNTQED